MYEFILTPKNRKCSNTKIVIIAATIEKAAQKLTTEEKKRILSINKIF